MKIIKRILNKFKKKTLKKEKDMYDESVLTNKEIDLLMEGVILYESLDEMTIQTHDIVRDQYKEFPEKLLEFDNATKGKREKLMKESVMKKHQGIILKYKLARLKEKLDTEMFLNGLGKDGK